MADDIYIPDPSGDINHRKATFGIGNCVVELDDGILTNSSFNMDGLLDRCELSCGGSGGSGGASEDPYADGSSWFSYSSPHGY